MARHASILRRPTQLETALFMTANLNADQHDDLVEMVIPALPGSVTYGHQYEWTEDQSELLPWAVKTLAS